MSAYVSTKSRMSVQTIAKISILGALAFLVMMFEIPLPFAPDFYKLGFDEVIVLIGGFALGPWAAVCDQVYSLENCRLVPITDQIAARYREME